MLLFSVFQLLGILCVNVVAQYTVGQEVKTTSGLVKGHAAKSYPEVSEYLGIRFGESTEGGNRFLPPKPYISSANIDASAAVSDRNPLSNVEYELMPRRDREQNLVCL
jgi:carboxylesterase type B